MVPNMKKQQNISENYTLRIISSEGDTQIQGDLNTVFIRAKEEVSKNSKWFFKDGEFCSLEQIDKALFSSNPESEFLLTNALVGGVL